MKKIVLATVAVVLLLAGSALALDCPYGSHWVNGVEVCNSPPIPLGQGLR
jgi:hypothetical protein